MISLWTFTFIHPSGQIVEFEAPGVTRCKAKDLAYQILEATIKANGYPSDNHWKLLYQVPKPQ